MMDFKSEWEEKKEINVKPYTPVKIEVKNINSIKVKQTNIELKNKYENENSNIITFIIVNIVLFIIFLNLFIYFDSPIITVLFIIAILNPIKTMRLCFEIFKLFV